MTNPTKNYIIKTINDFLEKEPTLEKEKGTSYTLGYSIGVLKDVKNLLED